MPAQITVYDPTAPFRSEGLQQRILPKTLLGKTVGFIDNTKPNFSTIADDMAMILKERHGVKDVVRHRKRVASVPAPEAAIADVVEKCDLVITGSGD
jgi:hypothetical protein